MFEMLVLIVQNSTNSNETQLEGQEDEIVSMVRSALVDDESTVRSAAAKAFDILQEHLGARAIDQTIPTLLEALRQPGESSGTALKALKEVMSVSSPLSLMCLASSISCLCCRSGLQQFSRS